MASAHFEPTAFDQPVGAEILGKSLDRNIERHALGYDELITTLPACRQNTVGCRAALAERHIGFHVFSVIRKFIP